MSVGPVPRIGAHAFRHPLSARETFDRAPLTERVEKRPAVPRTQRPPRAKPTCGAMAREEKRFGAEPNCLSARGNGTPRARSIGANVMQQYFGRKNAYDREIADAGNQVFEWGPTRTVVEKDGNHARAAIMDRERKICGGHAPWAGAQEIAAKLEPSNARCHGRTATIEKEFRAAEQAKRTDEGIPDLQKFPGRSNCLARELKGPQQLAGDPVDSFARLGL